MTRASRQATARLAAHGHRRIPRRDAQIFLTGREINRWTSSLEAELLGIVASSRSVEAKFADTDAVLAGALQTGSNIQRAGLLVMWEWSWFDATRSWVDSIPLEISLLRVMPPVLLTSVGESLSEFQNPAGDLAISILWQKILSGEATEAEAREIVRVAEFGEPTPEEVDAILAQTSGLDGLSAMERIRTVGQQDIDALRAAIRTSLSGDITGASAVEDLAKAIKPLLSSNEGLNWKAKRIARTEGVRVSESAMRSSWVPLGDMLKGIRAWTAGDSNVRAEHGTLVTDWHDKLFLKTDDGFIAADGKRLPEFPAGPNCRCYTTQELIDELTQGLPPVVNRNAPEAAAALAG